MWNFLQNILKKWHPRKGSETLLYSSYSAYNLQTVVSFLKALLLAIKLKSCWKSIYVLNTFEDSWNNILVK